MEQQAKERLTGAVILVVLLVLLVPELLTGPRAPPQQTPAQPDQAPMRSYTMDLGESPRAGSSPVTASTTVPATVAADTAPVSSAPTTDSVPGPASAPLEQSPTALSAPTAPPPAQAAPAVADPPPPEASVKAEKPAMAPVSPAHAPGAEHGGPAWTVQLGTFSSRENAAHLVNVLKARGFSATLSETSHNGHKFFRVRVGAEHDRAAAQKLLGRLRATGEKGGAVVSR